MFNKTKERKKMTLAVIDNRLNSAKQALAINKRTAV